VGFSSVPRLLGWSFQQLIYGGALPSPRRKLYEPEALRIAPTGRGLRFPPLISCEKTAPLRQSLQKSPPSFIGLQRLSGCEKISILSQCFILACKFTLSLQKYNLLCKIRNCSKSCGLKFTAFLGHGCLFLFMPLNIT